MGLRLEAWTYPGAGTFQRRVANVDYTTLTYQEYESAEGAGAFTVDRDYLRLADIVDARSNVVSLMRIFDGETEAGAFFADNVRFEDRAGADVEVGGRSLLRGLEDGVVYPFDYATRPLRTRQPDWVYGGENEAVRNAGFEDGEDIVEGWESGSPEGWSSTPGSGDTREPTDFEVFYDPATARTGDYCLRFDATRYHSGMQKTFSCRPNTRYQVQAYLKSDTVGERFTMSVNWEDGAVSHLANDFIYNGRLMVELDGVARNPAANGTPGGSTDGTWQSLFIDFTTGDEQESMNVYIYYDHHSRTNGPVAYVDDFSISGKGIGLEPWLERGQLDVFELDTGFARSDDKSAKVRVSSSSGANESGLYQTVSTLGGRTVTGGMWVYHESGVDERFRAVLQSPFTNEWIASTEVTVPSGVWTRVDTTGDTQGDETIVALRYGKAGASPTFWVDDAFLFDGAQAASPGKILSDLLAPIQARGALSWLTYTFTTSSDSFGNPWGDDLGVRIVRGATMLEVLETFKSNFGIEFGLKWTGSAYELEVAVEGGLNSGLSPSFKIRASTAQRVDRDETVLGRGVVLVEGDEGYLTEDSDTALTSAFGRREAYVNNRDVGQQSLLTVASKYLGDQAATVGVEPVLYDRYRPHVDYGVGDTLTYERAGVDSNVRVKSVLTAVDSSGAVSYRVGLEEV